MLLRLALPKGSLQAQTADLVSRAGWGVEGYTVGSRRYRFQSARFPGLHLKVFQEKDIPIQVAIGNYDLGICGLDWLQEYMVRYPAGALVKVQDLGFGARELVAAVSGGGRPGSLDELAAMRSVVRLASEYPNLAEDLALRLRLKRFVVFPLWGGADVYPPETADLVVVSNGDAKLRARGLQPLTSVLSGDACLIANRNSWESKDMSQLVASLSHVSLPAETKREETIEIPPAVVRAKGSNLVWLALPDGHQQEPAVKFLSRTGLPIVGYPSDNRRPTVGIAGVACKVIRPQDMPLQVAVGNFALAVTGQDWLRNHLLQFPTSPARELLKLGFGQVRLVAVVKEEIPASNPSELRDLMKADGKPLRIASEYVNIADNFARENHLSPYRVIPTWGATEAFLPEDADLLIENTQTGKTLADNRLKVISTLFESSACLIGNERIINQPASRERVNTIIESFKKGLGGKAS